MCKRWEQIIYYLLEEPQVGEIVSNPKGYCEQCQYQSGSLPQETSPISSVWKNNIMIILSEVPPTALDVL